MTIRFIVCKKAARLTRTPLPENAEAEEEVCLSASAQARGKPMKKPNALQGIVYGDVVKLPLMNDPGR
jgi:hypothetical protein